jgi:hypothetical protein
MPHPSSGRFTYLHDADRRLVLITASETITSDDVAAIINRQRQDGSWSFGIVYDLRRASTAISRDESARIAEDVRLMVATEGPRGRVALVTTRADVIASGVRYSFHTSEDVSVAMFCGVPEGIAWAMEGPAPR